MEIKYHYQIRDYFYYLQKEQQMINESTKQVIEVKSEDVVCVGQFSIGKDSRVGMSFAPHIIELYKTSLTDEEFEKCYEDLKQVFELSFKHLREQRKK